MTEVSASRSANMRAIHSKDTKPELRVRRISHSMGLRFRLHRRDLPGNPDLIFPRHKVAMFVNGCFWHGHGCKRGGSGPKSNQDYWGPKIKRTRARDSAAKEALEDRGWRVITLWECELKQDDLISSHVREAFPHLAEKK